MNVHERQFESPPPEHTLRPVPTAPIPAGLRGTLFRSGPGLQRVGADPLNFFDGHALVAGLTFGDDGLVFRSRLVDTPLLRAEQAAGRMVQRRVFTNLPSRWRNFAALSLGNGAMHDVVPFAGKVFACNDPGHFACDGATLATIGPERWGAPDGWEQSPMPYVDPSTGRLIGWLKRVGRIRPDELHFVELDTSMAVVHKTPALRLDTSPAVVHDLRATERWYVCTHLAGRLSPPKAIWGARSIWDSLGWPTRGGAEILLAPRPGGDHLIRVPLPDVSVAFHVINAYDDGDAVIVDLCAYDGPITFSAAASADLRARAGVTPGGDPVPRPIRYVVDPAKGVIRESRLLSEGALEAPEVPDDLMGKPYRYAYGPTHVQSAGPDPSAFFYFDGVTRIDTTTGARTAWSAGPDAVCSPPAFVRSGPDEDAGWLLVWVHRYQGASVVVLDARDVAAGPITTVPLGVPLAGVVHTRFAEGYRLRPE